jgi:hypothetical protein
MPVLSRKAVNGRIVISDFARFDPTPRFHLRSLVILIVAITFLILACWWINTNITDIHEQQKINVAPTEPNR